MRSSGVAGPDILPTLPSVSLTLSPSQSSHTKTYWTECGYQYRRRTSSSIGCVTTPASLRRRVDYSSRSGRSTALSVRRVMRSCSLSMTPYRPGRCIGRKWSSTRWRVRICIPRCTVPWLRRWRTRPTRAQEWTGTSWPSLRSLTRSWYADRRWGELALTYISFYPCPD